MAGKRITFCTDRFIPESVAPQFPGAVTIGSDAVLGKFNISLHKITYDKMMFRPGFVSLTFSAVKDALEEGDGSLLSGLIKEEYLKEITFVDLVGFAADRGKNEAPSKNNLVYIAKNYYVQGFQISLTEDGRFSFTLNCYSLDRKLTLAKYCQVYSGKCLASEICSSVINAELKEVAQKVTENGTVADISDLSLTNLLMLGYNMLDEEDKELQKLKQIQDKSSEKRTPEEERMLQEGLVKYRKKGLVDAEGNVLSANKNYGVRTLASNTKELKHPYLVQYNESAYDFIARVAHRCGEFFYFENGKIRMGLPQETRAFTFDNTAEVSESKHIEKSFSYSCVTDSEDVQQVEKKVNSFHNNYVMGKTGVDKASRYRDMEYSSDEDHHVLTLDDNRIQPACQEITYGFFGTLFTCPDSFVTTIGMAVVTSILDAIDRFSWIPSDVKKWYKKHHLNADDKNVELVNDFGTQEDAVNKTYISNMCNDAYRTVENMERAAEQKMMEVNYGSILPNLYLGDAADTSKMGGDRISVVIRMHGEYYSQGMGEQKAVKAVNYVTVAPFINCLDQFGGIRLIPVPVKSSVPPLPRMSSMEAIVTDNNDPMRLGRVRVRYPWQPDNGDKSPWIRVSVPFAGGGDQNGGFCMMLSPGEHVMLDYVDGNPERPFVNGSLYYRHKDKSNDHVPALGWRLDDKRYYRDDHEIRSIVSGNGHALVFHDMEDSNAINTLVPLVGVIAAGVKIPQYLDTGKYQQPIPFGTIKGGGVTLRDATGMCTVDLNANKRNIDINSPFGTVNINAFTGITINAPNGDLNLRGKNINIIAGNNLNIKSGINIDSSLSGSPGEMLAGLAGLAAGMGLVSVVKSKLGIDLEKAFDLSYLRSVLEIFLKPVEGNLHLQSNRNTIMTAGTGKVTLHSSLLSENSAYREKKDSAFDAKAKAALSPLSLLTGNAVDSEETKRKDEWMDYSVYPKLVALLKAYIPLVDAYYSELIGVYTDIGKCGTALYDYVFENQRKFQKKFIKDHFLKKTDIKVTKFISPNFVFKFAWNLENKKKIDSLNPEDTAEIIKMNVDYGTQLKYDDIFLMEKVGEEEMQNLDLFDGFVDRCKAVTAMKTFADLSPNFDKLNESIKGIASEFDVFTNKDGNVTIYYSDKDIDKTLNLKCPVINKEKLFGQNPIGDIHFSIIGKEIVNDIMLEQMRKMRNMVKKSIAVQILVQCGDFLQFRTVTTSVPFKKWHSFFTESGCENLGNPDMAYTQFKDYISKDHKYLYGWNYFIYKIINIGEPAPSRLKNLFATTMSEMLSHSTGGIYSYSNGKSTYAPSIGKLFNKNGQAGPRAMSEAGENGKILLSSDSGHFVEFNDESSQWEPKFNPDLEVLKRYLRSAIVD